MHMDIFGEKRNAENFIIRKDLEDFIEKLSKIPIDPNRNFPEPRIIEYLPFHWELNQIYSILDYLCQEGILKNIFFIVINKDFEIIDVFLLLYKINDKNEERILKLKIKNLKKK